MRNARNKLGSGEQKVTGRPTEFVSTVHYFASPADLKTPIMSSSKNELIFLDKIAGDTISWLILNTFISLAGALNDMYPNKWEKIETDSLGYS